MSDDLIRTLKHQLRIKERDLEKAVGEGASRKDRVRELEKKLQALTSERDEFKSRAEANPDAAAELEKLRGEVRLYKHRDGMAQVAYSPEVGVSRAVPIDRLMTLMAYQPETDEFDAKSAKKALAALKESDPYLFGPAGGAGQHHAPGMGGAALSSTLAGLGSALGRGSSPGSANGPGELSEDQMRDPVYMSDYSRRMRTGK